MAHLGVSVSDWKVSLSGIGPGPVGLREVITDTGVHYIPKGNLSLYTAEAYEAVGLLCSKCSDWLPTSEHGSLAGTVGNSYWR